MKTICAWCKKDMGGKSVNGHPVTDVSHGICYTCVAVIFGTKKLFFVDFLESLESTVLVASSDGVVEYANKLARDILKKELPEIDGFKGGDVFECAYAKLPRGCGNTIHCDTCTIRNTVIDTFKTGKSHLKTPAYLIKGTSDYNQEIKFLISTELVTDVVLLRIDKVGGH